MCAAGPGWVAASCGLTWSLAYGMMTFLFKPIEFQPFPLHRGGAAASRQAPGLPAPPPDDLGGGGPGPGPGRA